MQEKSSEVVFFSIRNPNKTIKSTFAIYFKTPKKCETASENCTHEVYLKEKQTKKNKKDAHIPIDYQLCLELQ